MKLIVFSADAMIWEDVEYMRTLPSFQKYLAGGCAVEKILSVYPTITYPCHVTMSTGVYPDKHGITGNFYLDPGGPPVWLRDASEVRWKEDIFRAAKKAGYSTAEVFWPMTANHPCIDYQIPEFWPRSAQEAAGYRECYRRLGADERMLSVIEKYMDAEAFSSHPFRDRFAVQCACEVIRRYQPDVLFVHPANIDAARHRTGMFSERVRRSVEDTDCWLGELMQAAGETGDLSDTNLVLVSDHGQMPSMRVINPNVLLADHGLVRLREDGSVSGWDAWCQCGGMSAFVHLRDPQDPELYDRVWNLLCRLAEEGVYGFTQVFRREEAEEMYHLDGPFSFVLESDGYTGLGEGWRRPLVTNFDASDYRAGNATHGYLPFKGPQPVFLARGPGFRENVTLPAGRLIDEAPTFARVLGTSLPHADGCVMEELLEDRESRR